MHRIAMITAAALAFSSCGSDSNPTTPSGTHIVRETVTGTISTTSPACSVAFQRSVDPGYYAGGMKVCVEIPRASSTAGMILAVLDWDDSRIDLDLVLNDGQGMNYKQSIAAGARPARLEAFVNGGTRYVFVAYLRGVDPGFLANGGVFTGPVSTAYTLTIERPE
jgi:hypothetical protein